MKNILLLFLVFTILAPSVATAKSVLTRINRINTQDTVELYCSFTSLPAYRSNIREKRVDFILENTTIHPDFTFFTTDDKIVKILSLNKNNKTILSFFFRYPPQHFEISTNTKENKLTVDILLGNPYSSALPDFSSKLAGLTILERPTIDFSNPLIASQYAADWRSFFRLYESSFELSTPVQYTMLPFPAISLLLPDRETNRELLSEEITVLAKEKRWNDILPILLAQITTETDPEKKKKLALTYGDVLSRDNNFIDAFKQFYLLADEYQGEEIGVFAKYLLIHLRARFEDPFIADFELRNLEEVMTPANPLTPYFQITQMETALATKQYIRMGNLLARDDTAYPDNTATIRDLRQSDYWYGTGDLIKAYVGYQLLEEDDLLQAKIFSLNGYCDTLYQQKQFSEASRCYTLLSSHIIDKEKLGMINYRKYMAELHYKKPVEMIDYFARIENTYPATDAGFRAAIKKTDLQYLTLKDWGSTALLYYKALAKKSITRETREEATFKTALVYRLNNDNIESIKLIMSFLRDFRKGTLYHSGQALLIELFPLVIHEYFEKEMYMEALILAKKNRSLFLKNWVDIAILSKLAASYQFLGMYNEASKLYLYLITLSSEDTKERYYLPLISASYDHGAYNIVEDYADQYNFRYPNGRYTTEILLLRIKSLLAEKRYQEALPLMPESIPETEAFSLLAANIYFQENNYPKVIEILDRSLQVTKDKESGIHFMLAESYYQNRNFSRAEEIFKTIPDESRHHDQALYRCGELLKKDGKIEASLKVFTELVETGTNPRWVKMAQVELDIDQYIK